MASQQDPVAIFIDSAGFSTQYKGTAAKGLSASSVSGGQRFVSPYSGSFRGYTRSSEGYAYIFMTCVWAFRGISLRAQKVAELVQASKLVDVNTGKPVLKRNTLLDQALEKAFTYYYQDLWDEWLFFKYLTGKAFVELIEDPIPGTGVTYPSGLRVLNSLAVTIDTNGSEIEQFVYNDGSGESIDFQPGELVYDKLRNPLDDTDGYSVLGAALEAANIDRSVAIFNVNFVKNNARPGLIFTPKQGKLQIADAEYMKQFVGEELKGPQNAGEPVILPYALDVTMAPPPELQDQKFLTDDQKSRIMAAIGVPITMVDYSDMRYQLSPEQRRGAYTETFIPDAENIIRRANYQIIPFFYPQRQYRLELDLTKVMPILEDQKARSDLINARFTSGVLSWNESRIASNLEPDPGGDFFIFPPGFTVIRKEQLMNAQNIIQAPAVPAPGAPGADGMPKGPGIGMNLPGRVPPGPNPSGRPAGSPPPPGKAVQTDAQEELRTWYKYTNKHGAKKAQKFTCTHIDPDVVVAVKGQLLQLPDLNDKAAIKSIFLEASLKVAGEIAMEDPQHVSTLQPEGLGQLAEVWDEIGLTGLSNRVKNYHTAEEEDDLGLDTGGPEPTE